MRIQTILFSLLVFLVACQPNSDKQDAASAKRSVKEAMPGVWETISIRVEINSAFGNPDSTTVFEVEEELWEQKLGVKPIRTYYELDHKYRSEYRAAGNDTLVNMNKGLWNVVGDTLMLIEPTVSYTYHVKLLENGTGEFRSLLDWDSDGEADDLYIGLQRFISKSTQ